MEAPQDLMTALTWGNAICLLLGIWLAYSAGLSVQRLWLSPISHIPGPRLAALTQYYEFFYDVVLGGQFTFKLLELHKVYGPVVRISPWEVHVADHDLQSELYTGTARSGQKWTFGTQQPGAPHSTLSTVEHNHHEKSRSALSPFSTQTVHRLQSVVEERVDALLDALVKYARSHRGKPLNVMYPFSAFTYDVINEYSLSKSTHLLEKDDFGAAVTDSMLKGTHMQPFIKHVSWALPLINCLPESVSTRVIPGWGEFLNIKNGILDQIREIDASLSDTDKWCQDPSQPAPTILHDLISSNVLPPKKRTPTRLAQEGQVLVQGGTLTTSWVISLAVFHLLHRPATLAKLRDELFDAIPNPDEMVPLSMLENLPYLRAVVKESLRLGIGTSGRLPRIATHETLTCTDDATGEEWQLPPGTVVSMSPCMTVMDDSLFYHARGFIPERWLDAAASGDRLDKYLVIFGGGARNCLGMALSKAEVFLALAKLFRRWGGNDKGDSLPGDVGVFKIFEAEVKDCEMASEYFIPIPYKGSKGLQFVLELC